MCLEMNLLAVAEAKVDRGPAAGGQGAERVELAPGTEDLVEVVLLGVFLIAVELRGCVSDRSAARSSWRRFSKIAGECVEREFPLPCLGIVRDRLVDLDRIEFIGELESLDSGGQPSDRLVVLESVERIGAGGIEPGFSRRRAELMASHGLRAELTEQEVGQRPSSGVEQAGIGFDRLGEGPPPALAVVLGLLKALGHGVIDRRTVERDGGPDRVAVPGSDIVVVVVGEHIERGQTLKPPGFTASRSAMSA